MTLVRTGQMSRRKLDPKAVALWRYEQIEQALDERLHRDARGKLLRQISRAPVRYPSGVTKKISLSTLYRWVADFRKGGLEALQPRRRQDDGKVREPIADEVVREALRLLEADPGVSFTFLIAVLEAKLPEHKGRIARSTLQRRLAAEADYRRIKRAKKRTRRCTRFVARGPHDIWQMDAKGPVSVRLACGETISFHVLSVIDDATRAVLAALVVKTPDLAAAVRVFRAAALRWGLPGSLYVDRASIFDATAFRAGLAQLGSHRIPTRPRNAEARGKIEAYHRVLARWFTDRLASQVVESLAHLQLLLDGVINRLYQPHRHRGLKAAPQQALAGLVSSRSVPPTRLYEAFRQQKRLKAHRKTGEVDIQQVTYLVPDDLRGQRLTFVVDPPGELPPLVVHPQTGTHLSLRRAAIVAEQHEPSSPLPAPVPWGAGPLQAIYDDWRGQRRPLAEPGFGLPEIYALLAAVAGRHVPRSDAEAALVQRVYRDIGPLPRAATETAMRTIATELGSGRPIKTYLDALQRRVDATAHSDPQHPQRRP
jgi:transposase InsO family protein